MYGDDNDGYFYHRGGNLHWQGLSSAGQINYLRKCVQYAGGPSEKLISTSLYKDVNADKLIPKIFFCPSKELPDHEYFGVHTYGATYTSTAPWITRLFGVSKFYDKDKDGTVTGKCNPDQLVYLGCTYQENGADNKNRNANSLYPNWVGGNATQGRLGLMHSNKTSAALLDGSVFSGGISEFGTSSRYRIITNTSGLYRITGVVDRNGVRLQL
jgi:hypothetical protein